MATTDDITLSVQTPVFPGQSLETAIDAARRAKPIVKTPDGRRFAYVPNEFTLKDISDPHALPVFIKANLEFEDRHSMTSYTNRFSEDEQSIILADYDTGRITCRLDWHTGNDHADNAITASHDRHVATLVMRKSEEFARWDAFEGKLHLQEDFARFMEENSVDVLDPDQATLIEISQDLEATSDHSFKAKTRLQNGDRTFTYSEETRIKGEITVPSKITLEIPLYHGEAPVQIVATFREVATACAEDTGLPLHFGKIA